MCLSRRVFFALLLFCSIAQASDNIFKAIRKHDIEKVTTILNQNPTSIVFSVTGPGVTPLHLAAAVNDKDIAEILIAHNAPVDARTDNGYTPLHWAVAVDSLSVACSLLNAGADIDVCADGGVTPLHLAARRNSTNCIKFLIMAGANCFIKTSDGFTPLHWAVMANAKEASEILAEAEADIMVREEMKQEKLRIESDYSKKTPKPYFGSKVLPGEQLVIHLDSDVDIEFVWLKELGIWMSKYEITNAQYKKFRRNHSSGKISSLSLDNNNQPVVKVSWIDANDYTQWLTYEYSDMIAGDYYFRLPTEKEWEAAASAGHNYVYPWGNKYPPLYGNYPDVSFKEISDDGHFIKKYNDAFPATCEVGASGTNDWGLCEMGGNVWEWCDDWYNKKDLRKVRKGASWIFDTGDLLKIKYTGFDKVNAEYNNIGFRIVAVPKNQ